MTRHNVSTTARELKTRQRHAVNALPASNLLGRREQRTSARACVCVEQQQSTSSWSGVIEPARCVKFLNNRRQEQVPTLGERAGGNVRER